ncbi:MAG: tRNA pseudouridine synthase A, partial [Deltaproteobacteria bacterium]|nr:tRNA pseudouridine synthase A [Deltaproteobacteria bacterium]
MRNIKRTLEYDGTGYAGWQSQINARAIQDVVSVAIQTMVEHPIILRGSSRTDAGVHALGQVATFQTERDIPCAGFLKGLNSNLPEELRVIGCEEVPLDFHPIRNAKRKLYRYLIEFRRVPSPLWRNRVWSLAKPLDLEKMREASQFLVGEHDFKSF